MTELISERDESTGQLSPKGGNTTSMNDTGGFSRMNASMVSKPSTRAGVKLPRNNLEVPEYEPYESN